MKNYLTPKNMQIAISALLKSLNFDSIEKHGNYEASGSMPLGSTLLKCRIYYRYESSTLQIHLKQSYLPCTKLVIPLEIRHHYQVSFLPLSDELTLEKELWLDEIPKSHQLEYILRWLVLMIKDIECLTAIVPSKEKGWQRKVLWTG